MSTSPLDIDADGADNADGGDGPSRSVLPEGPSRSLALGRLAPLVTIGCAGLLGVAAYAGSGPLAVSMLLLLGVMTWGWPELLSLPGPRGTWAALGGATVLCVGSVALTRTDPLLDWLPLAAAGGVVLAFTHQLLRRDGRPRLVDSLSGELVGVLVAVSASAAVALPRTHGGAGVVLALAAAAAAVAVVELVTLPERVQAALGALAAVGAGALAAGLAASTSAAFGALVGLAVAVVSIVLRRLFGVLPTAGHATAALSVAVAPLAASGVLAYVLARLFVT